MGKNNNKKSKRVEQVLSKDVALVPIGASGKNLCLTLSTDALQKLLDGHIYPLEIELEGPTEKELVKINLMLNTTFEVQFKKFSAVLDRAKENAEKVKKDNQDAINIGNAIGNEKPVDGVKQ